MMSIEENASSIQSILKTIRESSRLIGAELISDQLKRILFDFATTIDNQQKTIISLQEQIKKCAKKNELDAISKSNLSHFQMIENSIDEIRLQNKCSSDYLSGQTVELSDRIEKIFNDTSNNLNKIRDEIDKNNQSQDLIIKSHFDQTKEANEILNARQDKIQDDFNQLLTSMSHTDKNIEHEENTNKLDNIQLQIQQSRQLAMNIKSEVLHIIADAKSQQDNDLKEIKSDIFSSNSRLAEIERQLSCAPTQLEMELDENGSIGLSPLLQAVQRDTRRIDSFDTRISQIRMEAENVANTVEILNNTIQHFSHRIYDFGIIIQDHRNLILERDIKVTKNLNFLGDQITESLNYSQKIADSVQHATSATATGFDEMMHILQVVVGRTLPVFRGIDEIALESTSIASDLQNHRGTIDISETLKVTNEEPRILQEPDTTQIPTPSFHKVIQPIQLSALVTNAAKTSECVTQPVQIDSLMNNSLEELRVHLKSIDQVFQSFQKDFSQKIEKINENLKGKIDCDSMDRIVYKLQQNMTKLQNNFDKLSMKDTQLKDLLEISKNEAKSNSTQAIIGNDDHNSEELNVHPDKVSIPSARNVISIINHQNSSPKRPLTAIYGKTSKDIILTKMPDSCRRPQRPKGNLLVSTVITNTSKL